MSVWRHRALRPHIRGAETQVSNGFEPERPWSANNRARRQCCPGTLARTTRRSQASPLIGPVSRSASMCHDHRQQHAPRLLHTRIGVSKSRRVRAVSASLPGQTTERRCTHGNSPAHAWPRRRLHVRVSRLGWWPDQDGSQLGAVKQCCWMDRVFAAALRQASCATLDSRPRPRRFSRRAADFRRRVRVCPPTSRTGKDSR